MNWIFSWFSLNTTSSRAGTSRKDIIESFIIQKNLKDFSSCLRRKNEETLCIDAFFNLLPALTDEDYMSSVFELIQTKSRLNLLVEMLSKRHLRKLVQRLWNLYTM